MNFKLVEIDPPKEAPVDQLAETLRMVRGLRYAYNGHWSGICVKYAPKYPKPFDWTFWKFGNDRDQARRGESVGQTDASVSKWRGLVRSV